MVVLKALVGDGIGGAQGSAENIGPGGGVRGGLYLELLGGIRMPLEDDAVDGLGRAEVHHDPLRVAGGAFPADVDVVLIGCGRGDVGGDVGGDGGGGGGGLVQGQVAGGIELAPVPVVRLMSQSW